MTRKRLRWPANFVATVNMIKVDKNCPGTNDKFTSLLVEVLAAVHWVPGLIPKRETQHFPQTFTANLHVAGCHANETFEPVVYAGQVKRSHIWGKS